MFRGTEAYWTAVHAAATAQSRAQAHAAMAIDTIEFCSAADAVIRTVTCGAWTVGAAVGGYYPAVPGVFTDAASGSGTPAYAVFKTGTTERFRCSCGTAIGNFYRLLANIVAGVPIQRGAFQILFAPPPQPGMFEPTVTTAPVISGTATVGQTLTVTPGTYAGNPVPTVTRQWYRGASAISGATGLTYELVIADGGALITCKETATNIIGSVTATSNALGPVPTPLNADSVPNPIQILQNGSYDITTEVIGGVPPYTATLTGTLPTGVTQTGNVLSADETAVLDTQSGDITWDIDDSEAVAELPQFGLMSAAGGSNLPFTFGHVFAQGDVPAGSYVDSDLTDWQCVPTTTWPDGSLRHAIIAGRATCVQNVLKTTALSVSGTDRSGTALTESDLLAAMAVGQNTLEAGSGGQLIDIRSLVGTAAKHRAVCVGPVMSNWLYRQPITGSDHLVAWFDVRLYKGGAVEVFPWVENAYLLVANPANDERTWTLTLGGTQRFSQSIDIKHHTRVALLDNSASTFKHFSYWIGTDPQIEPRHDTAYLMASKMVPNYGWTTQESTLADLTTTYTSNWRGNIPSEMGAAGFAQHIGILPGWSAAYLASSADARAYRSVMANGLASGSWRMHYVDANTNEPFRYEDYPTVSISWGGSPSIPSGTGGENGTPDRAHQPSMSYLPWLLSARWFFLDASLHWLNWCYLDLNYVTRGGADGVVWNGQVRSQGWHLRTFAQVLAILPESHPCFAGVQASWEANCAGYEARANGTAEGWGNNLGVLSLYSGNGRSPYGTEADPGSWWDAPWMQATFALAFGTAWDLDVPQSVASKASHQVVRDFAYKHPVGLAGDGSEGSFNFRHFATYAMPYGVDDVGLELDSFYADWGAVYDVYQAYGGLFTPLPDLAPTPGGAIYYGSTEVIAGNWSTSSALCFQYAALVMAKEHGVNGADAAWSRITGSSSWSLAPAAYAETPVWGVYPRNA